MRIETAISADSLEFVEIQSLTGFQGSLKKLSDENFERLKALLIDLKFSFVVHVWKNGGKLYILDGHQRVAALERMKGEGFEIPKIPTISVEAESFEQAKKKVLAGTSQFGTMTNQGLIDFTNDAGLSLDDLESFSFPEIDIPALIIEASPEGVKTLEAIERDEAQKDAEAYKNAVIKQIVLYFEGDVYDSVVERLNEIIKKYQVNDYSEAVLRLLDASGTITKARD